MSCFAKSLSCRTFRLRGCCCPSALRPVLSTCSGFCRPLPRLHSRPDAAIQRCRPRPGVAPLPTSAAELAFLHGGLGLRIAAEQTGCASSLRGMVCTTIGSHNESTRSRPRREACETRGLRFRVGGHARIVGMCRAGFRGPVCGPAVGAFSDVPSTAASGSVAAAEWPRPSCSNAWQPGASKSWKYWPPQQGSRPKSCFVASSTKRPCPTHLCSPPCP